MSKKIVLSEADQELVNSIAKRMADPRKTASVRKAEEQIRDESHLLRILPVQP